MAVSAAVVPSQGVALEWEPNAEPGVVGYKVYFGTESGNYSNVIDVVGATKSALPAVTLGATYYLAVSAYDSAGVEGPKSAELVVTAAVPEPPASMSFAVGEAGQGALQWRYPKAHAGSAERFTIYSSEDLETWQPAGIMIPAQATSSDDDWLYFDFPHATDKPRQFFKVGTSNAFGEVQ